MMTLVTPNLVDDVPSRDRAGSLHVVVEAPRGSTVKLKYDPDTGRFVWSRALVLGLRFPYDFGFFPQTLAGDGEPLDALVYAEAGSFPGVIVPGRAIGALRVEQRRDGEPVKRNDRVLLARAHRQERHVPRLGRPRRGRRSRLRRRGPLRGRVTATGETRSAAERRPHAAVHNRGRCSQSRFPSPVVHSRGRCSRIRFP